MKAAIFISSGTLIALLGWPAGMIAWKPGFALLAGLTGAALVFMGIGMLLA